MNKKRTEKEKKGEQQQPLPAVGPLGKGRKLGAAGNTIQWANTPLRFANALIITRRAAFVDFRKNAKDWRPDIAVREWASTNRLDT